MKSKNFFRMLLMAFLAMTGLTACSDDDEPKDSVKEIRITAIHGHHFEIQKQYINKI